MWMIRSLGPALVALSKGHSPNWNHVFIQVPIDAFGGLVFGVFMYLFLGLSTSKRKETTSDGR